jgi:hypothetical protein
VGRLNPADLDNFPFSVASRLPANVLRRLRARFRLLFDWRRRLGRFTHGLNRPARQSLADSSHACSDARFQAAV